MGNPLYQMMNHGNSLLEQFNKFRQTFRGDPNVEIQKLLNSGRVSQEQYNKAVQMAQQFQKMIGR